MRFYDKLAQSFRAEGVEPPVAVDITPVARMYPDENAKHGKAWLAYPLLRPPWPETWFEFEVPRQTPERRAVGVMTLPPGHRAAMYLVTEPSNALLIRDQLKQLEERAGVTIPGDYARFMGNPAHVVNFTVHVGKDPSKPKEVTNFTGMFCLNGDGSMVENSIIAVHYDDKGAENRSWLEQMTMIGAHALALLNCKNVDTQDRAPHPKLAKARARRGQPPGEVWKTLVIKVPGERTYRPFSAAGTGITKGRHIVRGHFATYGEHNKLFGRLTGTFYHPMHVRGRNKERKVVKDYQLKTEEAA